MTNLATGGTAALPYGAQAGVVVTKLIDCSETPLSAAAHEIINVPAGTFVAKVSYNVLTADTGSSTRTFDIGDGADPDGWADGIDAKTLAHGVLAPALTEGTPNTQIGFGISGKFYATADTIDLTAVQALSDAVIEVKALMFAL